MSVTGQLATMPVEELFHFLGRARRTGLLVVDSGACRKEVLFEEGAAVYCAQGWPKEMLGHQLLAASTVSEDELERALREQDVTGTPLGAILVDDGRLTPEVLEQALRTKVEDSILDLFTWIDGRFRFELDARPPGAIPLRVVLPWERAIERGRKRAEEMARIRRVLPDLAAPLCASPDIDAVLHVLPALDQELVAMARSGSSPADACARLHASDLAVLSRLVALVEGGALEVRAREGRGVPTTVADVLDRAAWLRSEGRSGDALDALRTGAQSFPHDTGIASAMARAEAEIRQRVETTLGGLDVVPALAVPVERLAGARLSTKEGFVATRVNGCWSVLSIARICPFPEVEALAILETLFSRGIVTLTGGRIRPAVATAESPRLAGAGVGRGAARPVRGSRLGELEPGPRNR